jgi:uncharacterized protein (TIGR02722 family)
MKLKNQYPILAPVVCMLLALSGCATPTTIVDRGTDRGPQTLGLDYRDFETASNDAIEKMLKSQAVVKSDGGRYVLAISQITNDTMQRIDTDQLVKKIRIALLDSGKVVVTTAVGIKGPEDALSMQTRELRNSSEFNQATVAGQGQMIAPDLSLSGKIIQRNNRLDSGDQQVEYYFQLSLTDVRTGLAIWEGETPIIKRGSNRSVSW